MTTTPPPSATKTTKSRFFGLQKKKPWEEEGENEQERIEIFSAATHQNDAAPPSPEQPVISKEKVAALTTEPPHKENESNLQMNEEEKDGSADSTTTNPFAKFAFGGKTIDMESSPAKKKWTTVIKEQNLKKRKRPAKEKLKDWIRMEHYEKDEQDRITRKWHSLADASQSIETRRFQVLVAARLHARCQEPVVRKCMDALRQQYKSLDAETLSKADPEQLAETLSSLQYYNVKAKHLVAAANEIQAQFQGKVPEVETELRKITGIGPVMADLLAFVNTVESHTSSQL